MGKNESKGSEPGIWYVNGIPHPNLKSPGELRLRREAHRIRQNRPPRSPKELVSVRCLNPDCKIQNVIYQAADLTPLVPLRNINYLNSRSPIVGPCVVCERYTTEVVSNQK